MLTVGHPVVNAGSMFWVLFTKCYLFCTCSFKPIFKGQLRLIVDSFTYLLRFLTHL